LGLYTALEALLPICRIWVICSRVQESSVTDLLFAVVRTNEQRWTHTLDL